MERYYKSRIKAADAMHGLERDIEKAYGRPEHNGTMTFRQLVEIAKETFYYPATLERGFKTSGVKSYSTVSAALDVLIEYFGDRQIGQIEPHMIQKYREWRRKIGSRNPSLIKKGEFREITPATINRELTVMRRMFTHARDEGWIDRDVFRKAKAIHRRLEQPRKRVLTHEEVDRLIAACTGSMEIEVKRKRRSACSDRPGEVDTYKQTVKADDPFVLPMVLLAVDSGLRRGEILQLRWTDIDANARHVTLRASTTKTERERTEGLTDRTIKALEDVRNGATDGPVFPSSKGGGLYSFNRAWSKVRKIANLEDIVFHDLRRTAATVLVKDLGLSLDYASKLLGHSDSSTTLKHYISVEDAAKDLVTDRLNELHRQRIIEATSEYSN